MLKRHFPGSVRTSLWMGSHSAAHMHSDLCLFPFTVIKLPYVTLLFVPYLTLSPVPGTTYLAPGTQPQILTHLAIEILTFSNFYSSQNTQVFFFLLQQSLMGTLS